MSIILELRERTQHAGIPLIHPTSEHVVLSNVFGVTKNLPFDAFLNPWLESVTSGSVPTAEDWQFRFWEHQPKPDQILEGSTEVDLVIESTLALVFTEVKMNAGPSPRTSRDSSRHQLVRNLDIGYSQARTKGLKFALIYVTPELTVPDEVNRLARSTIKFPCNEGVDPARITHCLYWTSWSKIGEVLARSYKENRIDEKVRGFALDLLAYLTQRRLWENTLPDEPLFYGNKLYRSLQVSNSPFIPYSQQRPESDNSWRDDNSWNESSLRELLACLGPKQRSLLKVLADAGGELSQGKIMQKLPFLNNNPHSLLGVKAQMNRICKQRYHKAPIVDWGTGTGNHRIHRINPDLGGLRKLVMEESKRYEIPAELLERG
jgi:hypothetical protein